jgi:hypothetical protein
MRVLILALTCALLLAAPAAAQTANPEMQRIFAADQADRKGAPNIDWKAVGPRDAERRSATRNLLTRGALTTAEDYRAAAFVFQHGSEAGDYLLAHTLAMVAAGKGDKGSLWIASATLDRYLMKVGQPQIFGTQFSLSKTAGAAWSQEPYDRALVSDALRKELGVPPLAEQEKQLAGMKAPVRP